MGLFSFVGDIIGDITGASDVADASRQASSDTLQVSRETEALNRERFGEAKSLLSPYIQDSRTAQNQLMVELGLSEGEAGTAYMNTPGYQTMLDETREGVNQVAATSGNLYSGRRAEAAGEASGRVQTSFYNNYMNLLTNMASPTPATNLASLGVNQGITMGSQNIAAQDTASGYMMDAAQTKQAAIGDVIGGAANIYSGGLAGGYI